MINDLDMQGWAYLLAPTFQFVNTAGKPLTEGYLEVYIAGTRNKYYCASDFDGTLHPFQIPLDSLGSNIVLADPSQAYDVYAYNRFGSLVMSRYNVSPSNAGGSGVLTITISSNDDTVQVVHDGNNYDLSIADTIARIDDIEDRLDEIGDGSVGYAVAHAELASDGLFELTNDKNKDLDYTSDMHGFRLKPGHVYQLNFNAKFDCNNDTNDLISGKFYLDGDNVVSQDWQFNVDNSFEHQESFNGSTVLVIPSDVSYYDVKLKYLFDDEALDLYLNKISIVDVTSIVSKGASGGGIEYYDGDGIVINNTTHTINVDMDYINSHLDIDASSILSSAYNYTDARVSQASGDLINIIAEATGNIPMPEQVQVDWNQDDDTQVDYIKNKPNLDIYATHDEVTNIVSSVSSVLQGEIDNIPSQVQSDWTEDDSSLPSYIQHKPEVEEVTFEEINLDDYALASAIPDISNLATKDELNTASGNIINYVDNSIDNVTNVIESVSGDLQEQINNIPAQVQSDWNESDVDSPAYIDNKPDLSIYATETQLETVSGDIVAMIPNPQIQSDWTQTDNTQVDYIKNKPEEEAVEFEEINLSDYALASAIPSIEGLATVAQVSSVSSVLQNEINNIPTPVQSDWAEDDSEDLSYIKNKPTERQLIPGDNISITASGNNFVISSTGGEQVNANWNETDPSDPSYIENKPDLSVYATIDDVNAVTSLIPEAQVQSNWTEDDTTDPSYILNKPNELELVAGNNIEISVSGTNIVISSTASAVTGLDLLYGQFTSNNVSTTATMAKSKGNINVSNGKIQLEQGKSYHITVRGYYQQTSAANSYSPISYVEYITSNTINIDIDRSRTDAQYFELSYDLFNLNSDVDYQVAFSGGAGLVKDLIVEVHSLGGAGTGSSGGGSAIEYDAGYGINIANQVISVDSSIIPDTSTLATKAEVANVSGTIVGMIPNTSNLSTKAELNSASANIVGQIPDVSSFATTTELTNACNNVISMIPELPESANLIAGNNITITASGNDYVISSTASGGASTTYTAGDGIEITNNEISVDNTVALKSELSDVSGKLPTTETGKFTIQNNVSGGPIEVICPTDQAPDAVFYQINSVTGYAYANGTSNGIVNYYYGETPANFNGSDDGILITFNDNISNLSSVSFYYSNSVSAMGGPNLSTTSIQSDTSSYTLQSGTYKVKAQYNQAVNYGYGNYLQIMFNWRNWATDAAQSLQWTQDALSKITFFGVVRPDPALGSSVNLDRYYLGNTSTISNTYGYTEATIYTDQTSKKQSVYLPNSMPSNWLNRVAQYVQYGSNYFSPGSYSTSQQYIAYKYTSSSPVRYQYAICTDYDYTNRKMTFISYNESGKAIEKWTVNYSSSSSNIWTTETFSYATEAEIQAVSGALDNCIPYSASGVYLPNSKFEIDTDGQAYKVITPGSESGYSRFDDSSIYFSYYTAQVGTYKAILPSNTDHIRISKNGMEITSTYDSATHTAIFNITSISTSNSYAYVYAYTSNNNIILLDSSNTTVKYVVPGVKEEYITVGDLELNGNNQVSAIDGYELAGGSSVAVSGASGVKVEDSIVSLDNPVGLVAGENITIEVSGSSAIISSLGGGTTYSAGNGININNDEISIDNTVALKSEIPDTSTLATKAELNAVSAAIPTLPQEEEVDFEEVDLSDYALASAIPDVSDMATKTWVGNQGYLTSVPATYVTDTELASAVSGLATKNELTTGLNTKQDTLTGITDVQVVQSLPASPVATVLYLIPEV